MDGVEVTIEIHLGRVRCESPDQPDDLENMLVLKKRVARNGIILRVLDHCGSDALLQRGGDVLLWLRFFHDRRHRHEAEDLIERLAGDGRLSRLQLPKSEHDEEALENVQHRQIDRFARGNVALLVEFLLGENVQHVGQSAGVEKSNVQRENVVDMRHVGGHEIDEDGFQIVEHLRWRDAEEELIQLVGTLLARELARVRRRCDEAGVECRRRLFVERNRIENLAHGVAQTIVRLSTGRIADVD